MLVRVATFGFASKVKTVGVAFGSVPAPVNAMALGVMKLGTVRVPVRGPLVIGVKVTLIVQLAPGGSEVPHDVEAIAKSPVTVGGKNVAFDPPVLARVAVMPALVVPTDWLPK